MHPLTLFRKWLEEAEQKSAMEYPNAAVLSTVDSDGTPDARVILIKEIDSDGLVFYTNYDSRKGRQIEKNPRASLTIYWDRLFRQVRMRGKVVKVEPERSDFYFSTRPRCSRIGAWASRQSRPLSDYEELMHRYRRYEKQFEGKEVPRPPYWGGYKFIPFEVEFWIGRDCRLHERYVYTLRDDGSWELTMLNP